jgi:uncharacterized protein
LKLHLDRFEGMNAFTGYGDGHVVINGRHVTTNVVVFADRLIEPWDAGPIDGLAAPDLAFLASLPLEIVLLGTGPRMHLLHPRIYAPLSAARIGVEVMDTPAACRTYNILLAEGRKVAAALLISGSPRG